MMATQYMQKFTKRLSSVSPQTAIAGALIIVVVVSGLALLLTRGSSEVNAKTALHPFAARLDRVDGNVGIARAEDREQELDWTEASINTPVTVGDRIYTRDYAHASIALSGQNFVRLNPATALDVLALEDHRTQFALRSGSAVFDVGALPSGELYEVATPCGAVDFREPGLYQIGMDGGNAIISVLNGLAQVVGQEGSGFISKGQVFTLASAAAAEALASTLAPDTAGEIVDDYYRYRYPKVYNGRYRSYDAYLDDPSYYDPYRTSVSYQYLPADIPGLYDLDDYGDWIDVNDYGHCWAPRVSSGWAPYRSGYWDVDDLWGPSWVSSEPWGWAPYHYGRWAFVNQRWFWVPVEVRTRPVYSPALVAFIPLEDQIAWVPLGPGEVYVQRYYDDFRPRYLASPDVVQVVTVQNTFVNFNAPGAVTVVPVRAFAREIDSRIIAPVDVAVVGRSRAVIDPFSINGVRELATRREDGRRRLKFERQEQEALNTAVVASTTPEVLPSRGDLGKRFRVEEVSERRKANKLKVNQTAEVTSTRRPDGLPQPQVQSQRMNELASRAEQGDRSARREMRQLLREEQRSPKSLANEPQQPGAAAQQQVQPGQSRQQLKQLRKVERQQQAAGGSGQDAARQAKLEQLRQQAQQRKTVRQQQAPAGQEQSRQQMKQQRKAERPPQGGGVGQAPAKQVQQDQTRQQIKQQRRAERQQQPAAAAPQQQMRQQQKSQPPARRKPPEASAQQLYQQQQQAARAQAAQRQAEMQQQHAARAQATQRQAIKQQRQAVMQQQQAAQAQGMQRQAIKQQRQAAQQQQQAAQAQGMQRQVVIQQKQAARAQAEQRQGGNPSVQRSPAFVGPPAKQDSPRKAEKAQRKHP